MNNTMYIEARKELHRLLVAERDFYTPHSINWNELNEQVRDSSEMLDTYYMCHPKSVSLSVISTRIKEIEEEIKFINNSVFKGSMSAHNKSNRLRGIKKELKQLLCRG